MKNYFIKWVCPLAIVVGVSSCTMEKRLYSSGFNIQWNAKWGMGHKREQSQSKKQKPEQFSSNQMVSNSSQISWVGRESKAILSFQGMMINSKESATHLGLHRYENKPSERKLHSAVGQASKLTMNKNAAVPQPRPGESVEQLAQRKANKARTYGILTIATIILFYPAIVFGIIHFVLKRQAQSLLPNGSHISHDPVPRVGETVDEMAQRKANWALFYGLFSIPTSAMLLGVIFGVLAVVLSKEARELSPDNAKIQKRAKAAFAWSIVGFLVFAVVFGWFLLIILSMS